MRKDPVFFGLHASPGKYVKWGLAATPFIVAIILYLVAADFRHTANSHDKLLPLASQMYAAIKHIALVPDRNGTYVFLNDTLASLQRLGFGVLLAAGLGLLLGLNMGMYPGVYSLLYSTLNFISMIPPLAILPILFMVVGVDEASKVSLIFIGIFPIIARDILLTVKKTPREQITKALTLGAGHISVAYQIVLPQIMPRLIESVRLSLGAAWIYLIAAEAIASTNGLGYRIFLERRYLAMDVIIPYVLWISFLGFFFDWLLRKIVAKKYRWYSHNE